MPITTVSPSLTTAAHRALLQASVSGGSPPPLAPAILMEDGSFLLLEDGGKILLE